MTLSILELAVIGFVVGTVIGLCLGGRCVGCLAGLIVPVGVIIYISWWQNMHPENLSSTSGLAFLFAPIPAGGGALLGYALVWFVRDWLAMRKVD